MLTENQIKNLKHRLNENEITLSYVHSQIGLPQTLEEMHTYKGLAWLGKLASLRSSPFGLREQAIIANFARFELVDFKDTKPHSEHDTHHWYQPVYKVISADNNSFKYYYDYQKVVIVG